MATLFEQIGGERLRAVLADFYDRVFADPMIGFLFAGADKQRLIDKEWELTAAMLGGDVRYTGQSMRQAHARAPILGGHYERRQQLLRDTFADHDVPREVVDAWLRHNDRLRPQVTADEGSDCNHAQSGERIAREARRLPVASGSGAAAPRRRLPLAGAGAPEPRAGGSGGSGGLIKIGRWPG